MNEDKRAVVALEGTREHIGGDSSDSCGRDPLLPVKAGVDQSPKSVGIIGGPKKGKQVATGKELGFLAENPKTTIHEGNFTDTILDGVDLPSSRYSSLITSGGMEICNEDSRNLYNMNKTYKHMGKSMELTGPNKGLVFHFTSGGPSGPNGINDGLGEVFIDVLTKEKIHKRLRKAKWKKLAM
ncbi:hypothetical protein Q3G72_005012 [Acer saccharum]|nr:hypothetical protein Q3G72_005012 [Acer saccharum]